MMGGAPAVAASSVPFNDVNASGYIGLCDKDRHPVTSGSVYDQPFVWTAVSSAPAPKGYARGKAVLVAFQPRKDVDPGEWSGRQLTASSTFTNPKHPMSQATYADDPLLFFVQAFPPKWDGLVQLRMYFSAPDTMPHRAPYPATTIRITGDRWTLVSGGTAACAAGKATSIESRSLPKSALASPQPLKVGTSAPGASVVTPAAALGSGDRASAAGGGADLVTVGLVALPVLGGGAGGLVFWRRRRSPVGG